MSDAELIKTLWTVAQYGDNRKVGGLLEMAAHRLEELTKELAEAKAVTATYPGASATLARTAVPVKDIEGLQP